MDTPKQTFPMAMKSVLHNSPACDKIKANQRRVTCPDCGFLLARVLPGASASGLLLYCRKCRKQIAVNIPKPSEP